MKKDYTLFIYRKDNRYKTGERLYSTTVYNDNDDIGMQEIVGRLHVLYSPNDGWRYEYHPKMMTVRNLMTGVNVEIESDTPWCCNPASESYWSN